METPTHWSQFARFPVTGGTILLAIGVTIAWWLDQDVAFLMPSGGIRQGELWRLLTSAFPHVDIFHLVFNLYWTWVFGTRVESVFGHARTAILFGILALGSSAAEYAILRGGVGLSGVGYGLFGLLWVLSKHDARFAEVVDQNTVMTFVAWFFFCIVLTVLNIWAVANLAHGMGALLGVMIGWAMVGKRLQKVAMSLAVGLLTALCVLGATTARGFVNLSRDARDEAYLAYNLLVQNKNIEAAHWGREAVRIEPANAKAWFNLGITYQRLKSPEQAADAYKHAVALNPEYKQPRSGTSSLLKYSFS